MTKPIFILNGPNLNMLGKREPGIYGADTLADIEDRCREKARRLSMEIEFRQSNTEGKIVGWIQEAMDAASGIAINAGAYTHTSVAIHDALRLLDIPVVEVHLSNIHKRESFRHVTYVGTAATGSICGFGPASYDLAIEAICAIVKAGDR